MQQTRVGRFSIAYQRTGDGPALVLLHGFTQDGRTWRPQLETLSDQFTVIAWDAPGAGRSSDPPERFGIADWAECLAEFLRAIGVQTAHLAGLSWGGLLAQEYYRLHPESVRTLILADSYPGWRGSFPQAIVDDRLESCTRDSELPPADFVARYLPQMLSEKADPAIQKELGEIMSDFHPLGFRLMATTLAEADTRDFLPKIRVPTLLIWGEVDVRSPLAIGYQMRDLIPGSRLETIPGVGHVSNLEAPEQFNTYVRDFCLPAQNA